MKKIKLLHIVYSFKVGGIETLLLTLLNGLDKNKYEISLLSLTNDKLTLTSSLNTNIKVYSLNLAENNKRNLLFLINKVNQIRILLNKIEPDIVHNHLSAGSFLFIAIALKTLKKDYVHIKTTHSSGYLYSNKTAQDKVRLQAERLALKIIPTNLISISPEVHKINECYFKNIANEIVLISNGIDLSKFSRNNISGITKENFGFQNKDLIITYIARFDPGKNHDFLINLMPRITRTIPQAKLCFAGDGILRQELENKTKNLGLDNKIIFLGTISNVPELLSISDIAVFPSSFEGFGLVLLEYFAMGLPTVISNIKPFRDIVNDEEACYMVSLEDSDQFFSCLIKLLSDVNIRRKMGHTAYLIAQEYSIDKTIEMHEQYYSRCFNQERKV